MLTGAGRSPEAGASAAAAQPTRRRVLAQLWRLTGWSLLAGSGLLLQRTLSAARPRGRTVPLPPTLLDQARANGAVVTDELLVRFEADTPVALHLRCTHLGCSLRFDRSAAVLRCPCHGSHFELDGNPAGGPAEKPLRRVPLRRQDGSWEAQLDEADATV